MDLSRFLQRGDLPGASDAARHQIRQYPSDSSARYQLAELLAAAGDWDAAGGELEELLRRDDRHETEIREFQQLIRLARQREACFVGQGMPEFLGLDSTILELYQRAISAAWAREYPLCASLLQEAESLRVHARGSCDGQAYDDWRDVDDLTAGFLEVFTPQGQYAWVPLEHVLDFDLPPVPPYVQAVQQPVQRLRDHLWRPAQLGITGASYGRAYLPCIYAGTVAGGDDRAKLGQRTDWVTLPHDIVRGVGRRMWLLGDRDVSPLDIRRLSQARSEAPGTEE